MARARVQSKLAAWPERLLPGVVLAVSLLLALAGLHLYQVRAASQPLVGGAIADPPQSAPDFTLTDQLGQQQSLSGMRGKPVALTFIYTHCRDVCPIISANMHRAYGLLGDRVAQIGLLAVTVDPERDDIQRARAYSDSIGLTGEWHFLTGSRPQLEAVWAAYGIDAQKASGQSGQAGGGSPEVIEHAAPVFLIDKHGRVRAMLPTDVSADDIAHDLRILLAEQ